MTDDDRKLSFYIDAYSPETIPMAKLAQYMADFANLLGKEHAVYFDSLQGDSTKIVSRVEFEDVPKVTTRLTEIRNGTAPKELARLAAEIDDRLANDNAIGRILFEQGERGATAELLAFPGRDRPKAQSYGPFNQEGHLDGVLIGVGGKDETISVRLQNGEITYSHCDTTRAITRELAWVREADGNWTLIRSRIYRHDPRGAISITGAQS